MSALRPVVMIVWWFAFVQVALGATVSATVRPSTIEVGQSATLRVIVSGGQPRGTPTVTAPDNLQIVPTGRKQSFSSTPRGITHLYEFGYRITGLEEGQATLGPIQVDLTTGGVVDGGAVSVTVKPRGTTPRPKENLAVTTKFSRDPIWEGEVVTYEAELTSRLAVQDVSWRLPAFEGLQKAPHGEEYRTRTTIGDPDGDLIVLRSVLPLVATGTGDRTQPPATGKVSVLTDARGFFGRRRVGKNVVGQRAPLTVKPLPKSPPDFSGLVGTFEVFSRLGKNGPVRVGESVPWVVRVAGNGVIDGFDLKLPEIEGVQIYQDGDETVGRSDEGRYVAQKTFSMVLVPTDGGVVEIPKLSVVVFDPVQAAFVTLESRPGRMEVRGEGDEAEIEVYTPDGQKLEDAAPIDVKGLYTYGLASTFPVAPLVPLALGLVGFPGMLLLLIDGGVAARRRVGGWFASRKSEGPRGVARLTSLPDDPQERLRVLDLALREALADSVGVRVAELDREAALGTLERSDDVRHAFQVLDGVRFGGSECPDDIVERVRTALEALR